MNIATLLAKVVHRLSMNSYRYILSCTWMQIYQKLSYWSKIVSANSMCDSLTFIMESQVFQNCCKFVSGHCFLKNSNSVYHIPQKVNWVILAIQNSSVLQSNKRFQLIYTQTKNLYLFVS